MVIALLLAAHAAELRGTVTDADGTPLYYAAVYAYDLRLRSNGILSNNSGVFVLSELPAGRYRLLVRPDDDDNVLSRFYPETTEYCESPILDLRDDGTIEGLELALPTGGTLSGQLLDEDGAPVAGQDVIARSVDGTATEYAFERITETDADGNFTLLGLDGPGPWAVEIDGSGYPGQFLGETYDRDEAELFEVTPGAAAEAGAHTLLPGVSISGRVLGPADAPVSANVIVYSGSQVRTVQSDADGWYEAVGLPPGDALSWTEPDGLALTYSPGDDRPTTFAVTTEEGEHLAGLDIFPPTESVLRLSLVDAEDGAPIVGASATIYNDSYTVGKGGGGDDDGVIELTNLHGGDYYLQVYAADEGYIDGWHEGSDGERQTIALSAGETTELTLEVPRGAVLSGTVTDDDGAPIYGATVMIQSGEVIQSEQTDREGRYVLPGLAAGDWEVSVSYGAYCATDPGWVPVYWPGTVNLDDQEALSLASGEVRDGVDLVLPRDDDHDEMGDRWEEDNGLDPSRDDSQEDPDGDGVNNLAEYRLGTDPNTADAATTARGCGCRGGADTGAALLLAPMLLGLRRRRA